MRARARARLIAWFDREARALPWRATRDPYAIWVSEVMLQQTRVETVVPYYVRFLERFPTAAALAAADEGEVLACWSGLGYYRRARLLHAGVREVAARHGGEVPRETEARRALPGVGRYIAGAIGSIAFDLPEPIVDGNVARVLSRVHAIEAPLGTKDSERALWREAEAWVEGPRPGALNQALMELGATTCTPLAPRCPSCPLRSVCMASAEGRATDLPRPRVRKPPRAVSVVALVARDRGGRALLEEPAFRAREEGGTLGGELFRGLFGVPMTEGEGRSTARRLADRVGASLTSRRVAELVHVLTHRRLAVQVYEARIERAPVGTRLVSPEDLATLGVATLTTKILRSLPTLRAPETIAKRRTK
ncbi:MAG: A/G-specific adenine glycosylase [Sandaracinaceae bacterium]